jgi:hypothetical protein
LNIRLSFCESERLHPTMNEWFLLLQPATTSVSSKLKA